MLSAPAWRRVIAKPARFPYTPRMPESRPPIQLNGLSLTELQIAQLGQVFDQIAQVEGAFQDRASVFTGFALRLLLKETGISQDYP